MLRWEGVCPADNYAKNSESWREQKIKSNLAYGDRPTRYIPPPPSSCTLWRTLHPAPTPSACSSTPGGCLSSRTVLSHSSTFVSQTPRPGESKERPPPSVQLRALETGARPPGGGVGVRRAGPPRRPQRSVQKERTHGALEGCVTLMATAIGTRRVGAFDRFGFVRRRAGR